MLKNFICHQRGWLTVGIAAYIIVGSCEGNCAKKDTKRTKVGCPTSSTAPTTPSTDETAPDHWNGATDSLDSAASDASGDSADSAISSSSAGSGSSSGSSGSGSSSGYGSSGGGSYPPPPPPPPPTTTAPFAGLANITNSCYMNAVLQIMAALYKDEVEAKNHPLKGLINKINITNRSLSDDELNGFIYDFPAKAVEMVIRKKQEDPDEFIRALSDERGFLHPIPYTENLLFKIKNKEGIFQKQIRINVDQPEYQLQVSFDQALSESSEFNLSKMIASSREELVEDASMEIKKWDDYPSYTAAQSSFLKTHESSLTPQQGARLSHYIKQQVIHSIPSTLYVQLKRFSGTSGKIDKKVHGTMEITIHPDPNQSATVSFDLNGFILHKGISAHSGHYIAYVKREGKWYEANDSIITEIKNEDAIKASQDAYLLFYKR